MNHKQEIIKLIEKIENERFFEFLYVLIIEFMNELGI